MTSSGSTPPAHPPVMRWSTHQPSLHTCPSNSLRQADRIHQVVAMRSLFCVQGRCSGPQHPSKQQQRMCGACTMTWPSKTWCVKPTQGSGLLAAAAVSTGWLRQLVMSWYDVCVCMHGVSCTSSARHSTLGATETQHSHSSTDGWRHTAVAGTS